MAGVDLWTHADTVSMIPWAVAAGALVVAWVAAERCRMWSKRCRERDRTITRLRAADTNRRNAAMALPAAPKRHVPAPRTRLRWIWPGLNPRPCPVIYGTRREQLEADPCQTTAPMDEADLADWLATPEPARYPMSAEQMRALCEPPRVWVVSHLPDGNAYLQEASA